MGRRTRFAGDGKLTVVLAGLRREAPLTGPCRRHSIRPALYYHWRDRFLEGGWRAPGRAGRRASRNRRRRHAYAGWGASWAGRRWSWRSAGKGFGDAPVRARTCAGRPLVREERLSATVVAQTPRVGRFSLYRRPQPRQVASHNFMPSGLDALCARHLHFGYRRITALLRWASRRVDRKRVLRLMRERRFCVPHTRRRRPPRQGHIEVAGPNRLWQTDLTKVWCGQDG